MELEFNLLLQQIANPIFDMIAIFMDKIGDNGFIFILISICLMFTKRYRKIGIILFLTIGLTALAVEILKQLVQRPRPFILDPSIKVLVDASPYKSFPSGHAAAAFAFTFALIRYIPKYAILLLIMAILMGISRIYLFVHFPTDVIAAAVVAFVVSLGIFKLDKNGYIDRVLKKLKIM